MIKEKDKECLEKYSKYLNGEIDINSLDKDFFDWFTKHEDEKLDKKYLEKYLNSLNSKERASVEDLLEWYKPEERLGVLDVCIKTNWGANLPAGMGDRVMRNYRAQVKLEKSMLGKFFPSLVNQTWLVKLAAKYIFRKT